MLVKQNAIDIFKKKVKTCLQNKKVSLRPHHFKAWPFSSDFSFACKDGRVAAATCKYCPLVATEKFGSELVRQSLCGKISESAKNYWKEVY